jgi:hypothetical protein
MSDMEYSDYSPEEMAEIRRALAEVMGVYEEELDEVSDDGIIEMALRHNLLIEE